MTAARAPIASPAEKMPIIAAALPWPLFIACTPHARREHFIAPIFTSYRPTIYSREHAMPSRLKRPSALLFIYASLLSLVVVDAELNDDFVRRPLRGRRSCRLAAIFVIFAYAGLGHVANGVRCQKKYYDTIGRA